MFEAFFTDPCMRYRTEVINGIDFYGLGFSMVRGECGGRNAALDAERRSCGRAHHKYEPAGYVWV